MEIKVEGKRQAVLTINSEVFLGLIKAMDGTKKLKITGLPHDTVLIYLRNNFDTDQIDLLLESSEFELVKETQCFPRLNLTIEEVKERKSYLYYPITTCIKCNIEFEGMLGLHDCKLCNECAVIVGEIANKNITHIKTISNTKALSWLNETVGPYTLAPPENKIEFEEIVDKVCIKESLVNKITHGDSSKVIDWKQANREQLKIEVEKTNNKLQDLDNKIKILLDKSKNMLEKLSKPKEVIAE